ncbi:MAG: NAD(P)/FAD-dependent oxidoreductase [Lachnospiraceae bacterium]|nr:NAD(P)/FAD-dependent oxidoreductase [Lachnospiraceae bacterium]
MISQDVIVVGGGPAGMMAAVMAARNGRAVLLLEKNEKLGKKLYITGKGRCNFTNACDTQSLLEAVVTNRRFLYGAFYGFDSDAVRAFFTELKMPSKGERGGRVFPVSDHASDVIRALANELSRLKVKVSLHTRVKTLLLSETGERVIGVRTAGGETFTAENVILALGGNSYPSTGSDGETARLLKELPLSLMTPEPSLVPFTVKETGELPLLQGLSLRNIGFRVLVNGKLRYEDFGELLFTHFGLSGPVVLSASCHLREADYAKDVEVLIDLKPALTEDKLDQRILRDFSENRNRQFKSALGALMPKSLIPVILSRLQSDPKKQVNAVTKEERRQLVRLLKEFSFTVTGNRGFEEAIITRGGVDVKEVDPSTMAVKRLGGLYLCGEMLDTDAVTGGYNLQIAWATGALAGRNV